jgi:uncharacterized protein YndB with AHSA1/START domain
MPVALDPIRLVVETPAEPDDAWSALTDPDRVAEWFTDATPVGRPGDEYRLDFGDSVVEGEIVAVEPGRRFSHTWLWDGAEPEERTVVTWTVEARRGGGAIVSLEHAGWTEAGLDASIREEHRGYWTAYLEELEALLND